MKTLHGVRRVALAGGLLATTIAGGAVARAQDAGFRARVWIGADGRYVLKDNDPFDAPGFGTAELKVDGSALGIGGDAEYKLNKWIGIDGAIGYSSLNVMFTTSNTPGTESAQKLGMVPLLMSLNLHPVTTSKVDLWVGPQIGYVMFANDLSYPTSGSGPFTYRPTNVFSKKGFAAGADINFGRSLLLNLGLRWQDADADDIDHLTIDPTFVTIGFTKKY